jgi:iron complex outermembrane receptor protein
MIVAIFLSDRGNYFFLINFYNEISSMKKYNNHLLLGFRQYFTHKIRFLEKFDKDIKPIVGVSVYAPELHKGTTTDGSGKYTISNLPLGSLKLVLITLVMLIKPKPLQTKQLKYYFRTSHFKMDEVIVSTAFNKLQSQNVMKVEHAIKELQQKGQQP